MHVHQAVLTKAPFMHAVVTEEVAWVDTAARRATVGRHPFPSIVSEKLVEIFLSMR